MSVKSAYHIAIFAYSISYAVPPVFAQSISAFKDSSGQVYLFNLTPNSTIEVDTTKNLTRGVVANSCGVISIKSSQSFIVDGVTYNPSDNLEVRQNVPSNCSDLATYPNTFRTNSGAIAIQGKSPGVAYTVQISNYKQSRRFTVNDCGFVRIGKEVVGSEIGLPTNSGKAIFQLSNFLTSHPLNCIKGELYYPVGFNKGTTATASGSLSSGGSSGSSGSSGGSGTTVTVNPTVTRNNNQLIVQNIQPGGTYKVANGSNPTQFKNYSPTTKSCFIADRTQIGTPNLIMLSGTGITTTKSYTWLAIPNHIGSLPSC